LSLIVTDSGNVYECLEYIQPQESEELIQSPRALRVCTSLFRRGWRLHWVPLNILLARTWKRHVRRSQYLSFQGMRSLWK